MTTVTYETQQKTVVEKKCRTIPDQECKLQSVVKNNPVNTTECKTVQENKCQIVTVPTQEKECREVLEKKCRTVQEKVTEIVQVLTGSQLLPFYFILNTLSGNKVPHCLRE